MEHHYEALHKHKSDALIRHIGNLFLDDPRRADKFSLRFGDLLFDYSKTNIDVETRARLIALAEDSGMPKKRDAMFRGDAINKTEGRPALHTALRWPDGTPLKVAGRDIRPQIRSNLERMSTLAEDIRSGARLSSSGKRITDVINIGIGGSHLGPAMATRALAGFADGPRVHFVSNVDAADVLDTISPLDPNSTFAIVSSKTFTTTETMMNADAVRKWLTSSVGESGVSCQFAAISSATQRLDEYGIDRELAFGFEDWVGGRYSLWGPIGLSMMIAVGPARFRAFLDGGKRMDEHFRTAPLERNMPVLLGLVGFWHAQFSSFRTRAVIAYDNRLSLLIEYLQQLEMESNGKSVTMDGEPVLKESGTVIWGGVGTNCQHSFSQSLHQGHRVVPCEFLVAVNGPDPTFANHQDTLIANCLAQSEALMIGRTEGMARELARSEGISGKELERQARHRTMPGNRPSTTLIYPRMDPFTLGQIISLYEHRVFVEGALLDINSFDQWGVELGKSIAKLVARSIESGDVSERASGSTRMLVQYIREQRKPGSAD